MRTLDDVARFRADDDALLVAASLACPVCLGLACDAQLVIERDDSEVECACSCGADWHVAVDPAQVMRLVLAPPSSMLPPRTAAPPWRGKGV